jgi:hypothetical protein
MKTTRFSILSALIFMALAAGAVGCGANVSEPLDTASDSVSTPASDIAPEQESGPAFDDSLVAREGTGTIVPEGTKTSESGIAEPKILEDGDVPQDPGAAFVAQPPVEEGTQETAQESAPPADEADAALEPAHTAGPAFTPDPGLNTVFPNGKRQFQSKGIVVYQPAPEPEGTFQQAPHANISIELNEPSSTGIHSPSVRIDCDQMHLPGCP